MDAGDLGFWAFSQNLVWPNLIRGFSLTLQLTLLSGFLGVVVGLFVAFMRMSQQPVVRMLALGYITLFRGTPLLLQILFVYFALPTLTGVTLEAFPAGLLALTLNAGAYLAEIFRAGIQSIDKGQVEAAVALGMNSRQTMRRIVLPQTFRRLIPPVVNEFSALAKDTSLVSVIALSELLFITQRLGAKYFRPWEVYVWAAVGYLIVVLVLTAVAGILEKRLAARS